LGPELNDVIAVSPHTKQVMASGEALVIAPRSSAEKGFEWMKANAMPKIEWLFNKS
jgi:hypothetical protein